MANGNSNGHDLNRRDVLRKVGAGGIAIAGIPTIVSAEELDPADETVERVLDDPDVQSIRDAIGGFEIEEVVEREVDADGTTVTSIEVDTDAGTLLYAESDSRSSEARFVFAGLEAEPQLRRRLPVDHRDVPRGSDVLLIGHESSVQFIRSATDDEVRQLREAVGDSGDVFEAIYADDIDGYRVVTGDTDDSLQHYRVGANGGPIAPDTVEAEMRTAGGCSGWDCADCALWAVSRGICYWSCIKTLGATCIACIAASSAALPLACIDCFDNCL